MCNLWILRQIYSRWVVRRWQEHSMENRGSPLCSFGVITDVQFADRDDAYDYAGIKKRYYRQSLRLLKEAIKFWMKDKDQKPDFILQLGDLIDGYSARQGQTSTDIQSLLKAFLPFDGYICHLWGNHEFYNFSRSDLSCGPLNSSVSCCHNYRLPSESNNRDPSSTVAESSIEQHMLSRNISSQSSVSSDTKINIADGHSNICCDRENDIYCFSFTPHPLFRFVCLDPYDISLIGRGEETPQYTQALSVLRKNNKNGDFNNPVGLTDRRYVMFNGGISNQQLYWLQDQLKEAEMAEQKVLILSHIPVHPDAADDLCLLWNYNEILSVLHSYTCVVAFIAGHDHNGGFFTDKHGIHHYTFPALLECQPGSTAFAKVDMYKDHFVIYGEGMIPSTVLSI